MVMCGGTVPLKKDARAGMSRCWEEKMWKSFTQLAIEEAEVGVLGTKQSFGRHLHLKGGATGQIQLMQAGGLVPCLSRPLESATPLPEDWEWPYMFALADVGF